MSYQVLARKWRPKSFADMVGQTHVVRALSNALDRGQLHHAYLFTGTRGVGKTTLARILAKALNCEQGVSARPCGVCGACQEIDTGRFVDLLEVDAASRTKVDQTRELLDNVPFAPAKGRFKVYIIDEVHMFSSHSFNALLKTLEEPPPHVKFLLATTDPQKVPVTVLSRCLQFNLKRLLPDQIAEQLARILEAEGVPCEPRALPLLARAADGSMRDGLSLLDQAIAYGGGRVLFEHVRAMLGTVGRDLCLDLLAALARFDGPGLLDEVGRIAEFTPDFSGVLQELIGLLHQVALYQQVPETLGAEDPDRERISELAAGLAPEDVQLFYQIALIGQQDLLLAPDPRTGIEMVLLRMLAFRPDAPGTESDGTRGARPADGPRGDPRGRAAGGEAQPAVSGHAGRAAGPAEAALAQARRTLAGRGTPEGPEAIPAGARPAAPPLPGASGWPHPAPNTGGPSGGPARGQQVPALGLAGGAEAVGGRAAAAAQRFETGPADTGTGAAATTHTEKAPSLARAEDWHRLVAGLGLGGVARELAQNCELAAWNDGKLRLILDPQGRDLWVPVAEDRLRTALAGVLGAGLEIEIQVSDPAGETPARRRIRQDAERRAEAQAVMERDPVALALQEGFDARWVAGSIEPCD